MAKPNRALARIPKRPYTLVKQFAWDRWGDANQFAEQLRGEGFDVKITRFKSGSFKNPTRVHNIWKREK